MIVNGLRMAQSAPNTIEELFETPVAELTDQQLEETLVKLDIAQERSNIIWGVFNFRPHKKQEEFLYAKDKQGSVPYLRLIESGNKFGKTHCGVAEDLAHMVGFRPWLKKDDPNYWIKHGDKRIVVPNRGLVIGETITHSIMEKIYPTFEELLPKVWGGKFKKNSQGHITNLKLTKGPGNGSEVFFRSYDQPAKDFEGIDYHWAHPDEPPPQNHMNAILRGLVAYSGRAWLTMTPLREPYIYDRYSRKADNDKIFVITGSIWDNAIKNGGYLDEKAIINYLEDLPKEEREAREFGKWKHFAGVVYKAFDRSVHEIDGFIVPKDWTPYEGVDPADGKDTKWLFFRVSNEEFIGSDNKKMYRAYCTGYLSLPPEKTINEMVRQARIKRAEFGYEKPKWVVLDAKYGSRRVRTDEMTTSWEKELKKADRGVRYILSESKPGDVELGIKIVKNYLAPKYSTIHQKELPSLVFFREECSGEKGPIHEMLRYRRDVNEKLVDEDDDCPDVVRYFCMQRPKYRDMTERQSRWPQTSYG